MTGFASVTLHGAQHVDDAVALGAKNDLSSAYTDAVGRTPVTAVPTELGGTTLKAGVHQLCHPRVDGHAHARRRGQLQRRLHLPGRVHVIDCAEQHGGPRQRSQPLQRLLASTRQLLLTLDTATKFKGNILALQSIAMKTGATLEGRALARNGAVTLDTNVISNGACSASTSAISTKLTYTGPTTTTPGGKVTLSVKLKTSSGAAIAGKTVTFRLNGVNHTATTSSSGLAKVVTNASTTPGFYGDDGHLRRRHLACKVVDHGHPQGNGPRRRPRRSPRRSEALPATDTADSTGAASQPGSSPGRRVPPHHCRSRVRGFDPLRDDATPLSTARLDSRLPLSVTSAWSISPPTRRFRAPNAASRPRGSICIKFF